MVYLFASCGIIVTKNEKIFNKNSTQSTLYFSAKNGFAEAKPFAFIF